MDQILNYFAELKRAMEMLSDDPRTVFIGNGVAYYGTRVSDSFNDIPRSKIIEMPVAEDMQLGMSIGLSLGGRIPISVYPRWNFLILAVNQLVNHLDRLPIYSDYQPHVIIRVAAPSKFPLDPQAQHDGDFTDQVEAMCKTVDFYRLRYASDIMPAYDDALHNNKSVVLVEYVENYGLGVD